MRSTVNQISEHRDAISETDFDMLLQTFPVERFAQLNEQGFSFYRSTFWYPLKNDPVNVFERTVQRLRLLAQPDNQVSGAEWWFSVLCTDATPQWLLPCHFDRNNLREKDHAKIRHPQKSSVLFLNTVHYSELVVTDQVLKERGRRPRQPDSMQFVQPQRNKYVVFPGDLYHGVIGRMWREAKPSELRLSMAVNWWTERPDANYMHTAADPITVFGLPSP